MQQEEHQEETHHVEAVKDRIQQEADLQVDNLLVEILTSTTTSTTTHWDTTAANTESRNTKFWTCTIRQRPFGLGRQWIALASRYHRSSCLLPTRARRILDMRQLLDDCLNKSTFAVATGGDAQRYWLIEAPRVRNDQ